MKTENEHRLVQEYLYAAQKMQEAPQPLKKLFYFSVLFSEAQRVLNQEWDRDLALIFAVSNHTYTQVHNSMQTGQMTILSINWEIVFKKMTQAAMDIGAYYGKKEKLRSKEELMATLGVLSEVAYAVSGNGSYLAEKGIIKL